MCTVNLFPLDSPRVCEHTSSDNLDSLVFKAKVDEFNFKMGQQIHRRRKRGNSIHTVLILQPLIKQNERHLSATFLREEQSVAALLYSYL